MSLNYFVHPTAIVETVHVGEGTYIGPFTYISSRVTIGKHCKIYGASIGLPGQHPHEPEDQGGSVIIEDEVEIREYSTISAPLFGPVTKIGYRGYLMAESHIGHDCILGPYNVYSAGCTFSGHTVSGRYCYFGVNCCTHQRAQLGDYCMVGAGSFFKGISPSGLIWAGVPARPLKVNEEGLRRHASIDEILRIRKSAEDFLRGII